MEQGQAAHFTESATTICLVPEGASLAGDLTRAVDGDGVKATDSGTGRLTAIVRAASRNNRYHRPAGRDTDSITGSSRVVVHLESFGALFLGKLGCCAAWLLALFLANVDERVRNVDTVESILTSLLVPREV